MARVKIDRPDGSPSPYFWNDKEDVDGPSRTVYKKTEKGIKRMRGVRYNVVRKALRRD